MMDAATAARRAGDDELVHMEIYTSRALQGGLFAFYKVMGVVRFCLSLLVAVAVAMLPRVVFPGSSYNHPAHIYSHLQTTNTLPSNLSVPFTKCVSNREAKQIQQVQVLLQA